MLKQEGTVQRMDLNLRIECIGLETEIYQIDTYTFAIYCINYKGDFEELSNHFNYSIRQLGSAVVLTDHQPTDFLCKINTIPLSVNSFKAACITEGDLDNFIRSKFHDIYIKNYNPQNRD